MVELNAHNYRPSQTFVNNKDLFMVDTVAHNSHGLIDLWPCSTSRSNWNLEVFVEGGRLENPEKNPQHKVRTNNKLNPLKTVSTGIKPGSLKWEVSTYPLCHLCCPVSF